MAKQPLELVLKTLESATDWGFQHKVKDDGTIDRKIYFTIIGDKKYSVEEKYVKFVPVTPMDRNDLDRGVIKESTTWHNLKVIESGKVRAVYDSTENPIVTELYQKIAGARQ